MTEASAADATDSNTTIQIRHVSHVARSITTPAAPLDGFAMTAPIAQELLGLGRKALVGGLSLTMTRALRVVA
jgi:hypothetical protein